MGSFSLVSLGVWFPLNSWSLEMGMNVLCVYDKHKLAKDTSYFFHKYHMEIQRGYLSSKWNWIQQGGILLWDVYLSILWRHVSWYCVTCSVAVWILIANIFGFITDLCNRITISILIVYVCDINTSVSGVMPSLFFQQGIWLKDSWEFADFSIQWFEDS